MPPNRTAANLLPDELWDAILERIPNDRNIDAQSLRRMSRSTRNAGMRPCTFDTLRGLEGQFRITIPEGTIYHSCLVSGTGATRYMWFFGNIDGNSPGRVVHTTSEGRLVIDARCAATVAAKRRLVTCYKRMILQNRAAVAAYFVTLCHIASRPVNREQLPLTMQNFAHLNVNNANVQSTLTFDLAHNVCKLDYGVFRSPGSWSGRLKGDWSIKNGRVHVRAEGYVSVIVANNTNCLYEFKLRPNELILRKHVNQPDIPAQLAQSMRASVRRALWVERARLLQMCVRLAAIPVSCMLPTTPHEVVEWVGHAQVKRG